MPGPGQDPSKDPKPRAEPPAPESSVWLPTLAAPRGSPGHTATHGHSATGYLLPKARNLPTATTLRSKDSAGLFSIATLPTAESLGLQGLSKSRQVRRKAAARTLTATHDSSLDPHPRTAHTQRGHAWLTVVHCVLLYPQSKVPKLPSLEKSSPRSGLHSPTGTLPGLGRSARAGAGALASPNSRSAPHSPAQPPRASSASPVAPADEAADLSDARGAETSEWDDTDYEGGHDDSGAENDEDAAGMPKTEASEGWGLGPVPTEDALYDPDRIPGIETSDHVIEFYGKYGQDR